MPVLMNYTRPTAGVDIPFVGLQEFSARMGHNTGNMAFLHALMMSIDQIKHVTERPLAQADIKIWGCSNFVSSRRSMIVDDNPIYTDGTPLVAIGLGAQASSREVVLEIPEPTQHWIRTLSAMAPSDGPNISLRGEYTYQVLSRYGLQERCEVLGCPSLYISPNTSLGAEIRSKLSAPLEFIGAAPGNIGNVSQKHRGLERDLFRLVDRYKGSYLLQHPPELFSLVLGNSRDVDQRFAAKVRDAIAPELSVMEFVHWIRLHGRLFDSVPSWLLHLRSLDLVVSTRIHGAQLALQSGTPAVCIAVDARQLELCEIMQIPYIDSSELLRELSLDLIRERLAAVDWDEFDANRRHLARRFIAFLTRNGLEPTIQLSQLATQ